MNYQYWKEKIQEHKPKFVLGACFIVIFLVGYGTGKQKAFSPQSTKTDYTTKGNNNTNKNENKIQQTGDTKNIKGDFTETKQLTTENSTTTQKFCIIKGNISSAGSKIYHIKGGAFYDRTTPEQCFNTEEEAKIAGYRKSSR